MRRGLSVAVLFVLAVPAAMAAPAGHPAPASPAAPTGPTAPASPAAPHLGEPAPALDLPTLAGKPVALGDFKGKVLVVEFFGTWCGFCEKAAADLDAIRKKLGGRFQLVLVDVAEPPTTINKYLAVKPLPDGAILLLDAKKAASQRWGQRRYPTTFLVDEQGIIRHIDRGYGPTYLTRVTRWLLSMLEKLA